MSDDTDLTKVAETVAASGFTEEADITVESLANLTQMLSAQHDIRMVPGDTFAYDAKTKRLTYDRARILTMDPKQATGLVFHEMGHARQSQSKYNIKDFCKKVATKTGDGHEISSAAVFKLIEAGEDERMETTLREEYQNLRNSFLPRVDGGWRAKGWAKDKARLDTVSKVGETNEQGGSVYWDRVRTAVRGLVSGAITEADLPPDMPWDELTAGAVKDLAACSTVDQLMERYQSLVPAFARFRKEYLEEQEKEQEGDGGSGGGPPGADGKGADDGLSGEADGDKSAPPEDFNNGGGGAGFSDHKSTKIRRLGPAWSSVRMSAANMSGSLTRAVRQNLRDNEILARDSGYKSGRLHSRSIHKTITQNSTSVYSRRADKSQLSYAIALLVDGSGSMQSPTADTRYFPDTFGGLIGAPDPGGYGGYRDYYEDDDGTRHKGVPVEGATGGGAKWTFAARLTVALSEVVGRFREVKMAIARFDDDFTWMKRFNQPWTQDVKQNLLDEIVFNVNGGTENAKAFKMIADEMRKMNVDRRICICLTDGQFTDRGTDQTVKYMLSQGIDLIVLTLGTSADYARRYVGDRNADMVTDDTVGTILGNQLKKRIKK